jgi:hypothetical protein
MALSYQYAGGYNTFIPNLDTSAQGALQVAFSRNVDTFKINQYTQLQQVEIEAGKYWRFDQNSMARVNTGDGSQFIWADGADRPAQNIWQGFVLPQYVCTRMNFGFLLGDLAKYNAQKAGGVDLVAVNASTVAGAAMVQRTRKALAKMSDLTTMQWLNMNSAYNATLNTTANGATNSGATGNWSPSGYGVNVGLTQGHYWDAGYITGTAANTTSYFRAGVNGVMANLVQASNGMVQPKDINIIMGPDTAIALAQSAEVTDYVKQSPFALPNLLQDATFGQYGLPSTLFGAAKIIVEDASYISGHPMGSNTATRSWVLPLGTIIFASRPGGIEGSLMSFSTCMGFFLEEMTVETFDSPQNRYTAGNVVENYDYQITAPITGCVVLHAVSNS